MRFLFVKRLFVVLAACLAVTACAASPDAGEQNRMQGQDREEQVIHTREARTNEPVSVYGQWGRLGMEEVQKRYPQAKILDYDHIGRQAAETFRYELKQNGRVWTVHAIITFDPQTNEVISVELQKEK
jgi:hypothetical protein